MELTIQFPLPFQPLVDERDGPAVLRFAYNRQFLDSINTQVMSGTQSTGFGVEAPCSIASGLITVEQDVLLWTTDNAQDPSPASIWVSAWLLTPRGVLIAQLLVAGKTQFIVPSSLEPTTTWSLFSNRNQAVFLSNAPDFWYTAAEVDRLVRQWMDDNPASDVDLGTVLLTVPADIPTSPVVWGANDPLVRDAVKIQGVDVTDTAPLDTQVLAYNQSNNQYEPSNQAAGTGNVVSNEVVSVDGNVTLASGTGGKTIKLDSSANFDGAGLLTGATVGTPATGTEIANKDYVDSAVGGAGAILANGTVPFAADESMGGFSLTNLATPDALTDAANKDFVLQSVAAAVQQTPNISALVSGGGVLWESAYIFRVSQATYLIQGDLFSSVEQTVTLDAADALLDRIDVIALDSTGTVVKITGVAAAQPSQPDVDPGTQLLLTFVFVGVSTTAPASVVNEDIYIDNAEWTATTSGSGWNPNSTNNPHSGTKCIEGTNVATSAYVQLQAPSPLTLDTYALLSVFIRSKAAWPKNRSLLFQWYSAGVAKGVAVTINTGFFGFDSSQITTYQLLAIPLGQFAVPSGTSINQLRITDKGGAIGMYIDDLVLQAFGGDIGPPATGGLTQEQADARYLQQASNLSDVVTPNTALNNILPSQTANNGKVLQTDGSNTSWQTPAAGTVTSVSGNAPIASSGGATPAISLNDTVVTPGSYTNASLTVDQKGRLTAASSGSTPAPSNATYLVQTADGTLGNEQAMGALGTGLVKNTTTTGVQSIAAAGTDYVAPGAVTTSGLTQATGKLLGRSSASTGAVEEITVGGGLSLAAGTLTSSASPGGSDTQVQFNDGGAFGGDAGFTYDKTNNSIGLTQGTITTSQPVINHSVTWNGAGVSFHNIVSNTTNTASNAAGPTLIDLQLGGVSQFSILKTAISTTALTFAAQSRAPNGSVSAPAYSFTNETNSGFIFSTGAGAIAVSNGVGVALFGRNGTSFLQTKPYGFAGATLANDSIQAGFGFVANGQAEILGTSAATGGTLFSRAQSSNSSTSFTPNLAAGTVRRLTLNGVTPAINAPTNQVTGIIYTLILIQDATGSRIPVWNAVFKWAGGIAPVLTLTANAVDIVRFVSDGTNMLEISRTLDVK